MKKKNFEKTIKTYINDGFRFIDIELYNGDIIGVDFDEVGSVYFGENALSIVGIEKFFIKYSDIKDIVI